MQADTVLTAGEWEALLQAPVPLRPLVYRLAVHHGAVERTGERGILKYGPVLPDGPEITWES